MEIKTIVENKLTMIETKQQVLFVIEEEFFGPFSKFEKHRRFIEAVRRLSEGIQQHTSNRCP